MRGEVMRSNLTNSTCYLPAFPVLEHFLLIYVTPVIRVAELAAKVSGGWIPLDRSICFLASPHITSPHLASPRITSPRLAWCPLSRSKREILFHAYKVTLQDEATTAHRLSSCEPQLLPSQAGSFPLPAVIVAQWWTLQRANQPSSQVPTHLILIGRTQTRNLWAEPALQFPKVMGKSARFGSHMRLSR